MSDRHSYDRLADEERYRARPEPAHRPAEPLRRLDSATLFGGAHEIGIEHHGALYRLKITRQGKLILNK